MKNDQNHEKPCVLVTGRNYCNILTIARALGIAGYDVIVLKVYKKKPNSLNLLNKIKCDAHCKYVISYHECIANNNYEVIVNKLIDLNNSNNKMLLLPVDDYLVHVVDEHLDHLSEKFIIPNISNGKGKINFLLNKNEQKRLAKEANLPILNSTLIKIENKQFDIPNDIVYPCFIKPNISMKSNKSIIQKCIDEDELRKALSSVSNKNIEILVEDYAQIKNEYSLLGLCTPEKCIAPGLFKVIEGGHRERKGVTIVGEIVKCDEFQEFIDKCNKYVKSLNYTGMFDIDFLETDDGKIYFVELNFRAGASIHATTEMGINLPKMLADYYLKNIPINDELKINESGKRFVSEKVLFEEYVRSDVDYKTLKSYIDKADIHFVKDESDQGPYNHLKKFMPIAMLMRVPYRMRDRIK